MSGQDRMARECAASLSRARAVSVLLDGIFAPTPRPTVPERRFDRDAADLAAIALRLGGDGLRTRRLLMAALLRACPACELRPILEGEIALTATLDDPDDREGWAARRDTHYALRDALAELADRHDDLGHDADEKAGWAPDDWAGHGTHEVTP